jgi:hypothetical protein
LLMKLWKMTRQLIWESMKIYSESICVRHLSVLVIFQNE